MVWCWPRNPPPSPRRKCWPLTPQSGASWLQEAGQTRYSSTVDAPSGARAAVAANRRSWQRENFIWLRTPQSNRPPISVADPDPGSGAFSIPGFGMGKKSRSGSGIQIRDEYPGSYFREIRNNFWVKYIAILWCGLHARVLAAVPDHAGAKASLLTSVADPWHFGTERDSRIRTEELTKQ